MAAARGLRLGGPMKDHYVVVTPEGFDVAAAPLVRDGKRLRFKAPRFLRWDELSDVDAELRKPRVKDFLGVALNAIPSDSDAVEANPRGYVRLAFFLTDGTALHADIPRSLRWRPDQAWVDEFLAGARLAIEQPETRASFAR